MPVPSDAVGHDLTVDDVQVRVWEFRPRTQSRSRDVVLLHGMGDDGLCLQVPARFLAEHGYRVLCPDSPGHGFSGLPSEFTFAMRASSAAGVIEQLCDEPVALFGHSMGAESAGVLAATRHDLVRATVLEEPTFRFGPGAVEFATSDGHHKNKQWIDGLQETDHAGRLAWVRDDGPLWRDEEYGPWAEAKARCNTAVFELPYDYLIDYWLTLFETLTIPTLVITGDVDKCIVDDYTAAEFRRLVPTGDLLRVAGTGHCVRRDNPEVVQAAILGFTAALG